MNLNLKDLFAPFILSINIVIFAYLILLIFIIVKRI